MTDPTSRVQSAFPIAVLLAVAAALPAQDDPAALVRQLLRERDDAPLELVQQVARLRTREAAVGLGEIYDAMATLLYRREVARALASLANNPEAQQVALDKLAAIAGSTDDTEQRRIALEGLGDSRTVGKQLLHKIVASRASDELREPAMKQHVELADAGDVDWYKELWNLEQKQRKDENGDLAPPEASPIRLMAFEGLLPHLSEAELIETIKRERDTKIRRRALDFMDRNHMAKAAEVADWVLGRVDYPGADRAMAARILFEQQGDKVVGRFLDLAKKRDDQTPGDLRAEMAALLAGSKDDATQKRLKKLVGKGKTHEKVFALQVTTGIDDDKFTAAVRKQLADKEPEVRWAAAAALGARRDRESLPALRQMLTSPKDPGDAHAALAAIDRIEGAMSAWLKELGGYCAHADQGLRNAAIELIGKARDKRQLEPLLQALEHPDWSTRLAAVDALLQVRDKAAVGRLVARIGEETGRMRKQVAEALWQLTAQPFDEDVERWRGWWKDAEKDFELASEKDLDAANKERERRRLTQRTVAKAKFFGIQVESHRVIFVLDVSGSMLESMYGRKIDGHGAARIDVAKAELSQAIENLEQGALFNVFVFSSGVDRWLKSGIAASSAADRADARTWVGRLGASGGTNLYDSLRAAFADPDVDTIFVLSDGEPTVGEIIDPHGIRLAVQKWNEHRKVVIHTIAIGGNLEVLEWVAKDSGGSYRQLR